MSYIILITTIILILVNAWYIYITYRSETGSSTIVKPIIRLIIIIISYFCCVVSLYNLLNTIGLIIMIIISVPFGFLYLMLIRCSF